MPQCVLRSYTTVDKGSMAVLLFTFLFRQHAEYLLVTKMLEHRHQLDTFMFSELCLCCLQQQGLSDSLWRATQKVLAKAWVIWGFCGIPLANNSDVTQTCYQKLRLVTRDGQVDLCLPLFVGFIESIFTYANVQVSAVLCFHATLNSSCLPLFPTLSPFHSHVIISFHTPLASPVFIQCSQPTASATTIKKLSSVFCPSSSIERLAVQSGLINSESTTLHLPVKAQKVRWRYMHPQLSAICGEAKGPTPLALFSENMKSSIVLATWLVTCGRSTEYCILTQYWRHLITLYC